MYRIYRGCYLIQPMTALQGYDYANGIAAWILLQVIFMALKYIVFVQGRATNYVITAVKASVKHT